MTLSSDELAAVAATEVQRLQRLAHLGDAPTAGPAPQPGDPPSVEAPVPRAPRWVGGWYLPAKRFNAHPGRVGGPIVPWSVVAHTTDMLPDEWDALIAAWTTRAGEGACATFAIGRTELQGLVQFCAVDRNANHAGGPGHGVFVVDGKQLHPNTVAVGIEIHCAGGVRLVDGQWRLVEGGVAHGAPLPASDVTPDPQRPGRGWHKATDYQLSTLAALLDSLEDVLAPVPIGARTLAFGETPPAYAVMPTARLVTHAQLDPVHRADPWPEISAWLKVRAAP